MEKYPGLNTEIFRIDFSDRWLEVNDVFMEHTCVDGESISTYLEVVSHPRKVWWKRILSFLTLGIYKAPWEYEVKRIKRKQK